MNAHGKRKGAPASATAQKKLRAPFTPPWPSMLPFKLDRLPWNLMIWESVLLVLSGGA
jgi:hypothetical protein